MNISNLFISNFLIEHFLIFNPQNTKLETSQTPLPTDESYQAFAPPKPKERYVLHLVLFLLTLACTVWAGAELTTGQSLLAGQITDWGYWIGNGLWYAVPFLLFLTAHEFGHYFAARYHGISASLPYYIPAPTALLGMFSIGTFGAVIRIREPLPSTRKLFDVGAAGPLAGFVVALGVLLYGLFTLPDPSYMERFADEGHLPLLSFIQKNGRFPFENEFPRMADMMIGQTLLFKGLSSFFPNMPPMYEMYHYPLLFAGWLGLFFTALNLLPVGQLDGGHIWYALIGGKKHLWIARFFVCLMLLSASLGYINEVSLMLINSVRGIFYDLNLDYGYEFGLAVVWILWSFILYAFTNRLFKGDAQRWALPAWATILGLTWLAAQIGQSALQYGYFGWFLWSFMLIRILGIEHPPVQIKEKLDPTRKALAILCILIFILCFSPTPIYIG